MSHQLTTLPNGLRVITETMTDIESVSLYIGASVGSRYETEKENGISHFLEHMAFKGTARRSAREIAEEFVAIGGYLNAYTDREHTIYTAKVLKEDFGIAADILGDILQHSLFSPEEVNRERMVIAQEIAQTNDTPDDIIFDHFQETAFPGQALGRSILGTEKTLEHFTQGHLQHYVASHYGAGRMVVAAAGNITHEEVLKHISAGFTSLPESSAAVRETARYKGGCFLETRELEQSHFVLGVQGFSYNEDIYYTLQLLSLILGGGMSSRLFQEVRERRGLVYSIQSFVSAYADTGTFGIYAATGEEQLAELVPVITEEIRKLIDHIHPAELHRAQAQVKSSLLMGRESSSVRAEDLVRNYLSFGRHITPDEITAKVLAITLEDIKALMYKLVHEGTLTVAAIGALSHLPDYEKIDKLIRL